MTSDMETLFNEARCYGRVNIFTSKDGTYSATIDFDTLANITLQAKSGFNHATVNTALKLAIDNAVKICQSVDKIKERKLLT